MIFLKVQCQLYCTRRSYCDFVVWLKEDFHEERIYLNEEFMASCIEKARHFFQVAVLPELLGKFFSRPSDSASSTLDKVITLTSTMSSVHAVSDDLNYTISSVHGISEDDNRNEVYCYCQKGESGNMIGCDNPECQYGWFHFSCLKLSSTPKNKKWYCRDRRKLPSYRKKTNKQ